MGQVLTCKLWASPQQPIALQDSLLELGERAGPLSARTVRSNRTALAKSSKLYSGHQPWVT